MPLYFTIPEQLERRKAYTWLASWFGCGFIRPAPGTWGSLGALPFGLALYALGGVTALLIAVAIATIIGFMVADKFDKAMGGNDSSMIVIDEVVGQWIALIPAVTNPYLVFVAFVAFRFFDILKPWPVSFFDKKIKGAAGVMGDDIIAGSYAAMMILLMQALLF
ncbi:MAG: phosphatidylglycerophosphatase A [Alphaproteobacteria bacterium]